MNILFVKHNTSKLLLIVEITNFKRVEMPISLITEITPSTSMVYF